MKRIKEQPDNTIRVRININGRLYWYEFECGDPACDQIIGIIRQATAMRRNK